MITKLLCSGAILGVVTSTMAGDCHVVQQKVVVQKVIQNAHVQNAHVHQNYVQKLVVHDQFGFFPIYGAGYNDSFQYKANEDLLEQIRVLTAKVDSLAAAQQPAKKQEAYLSILQNNCAKCHSEGSAKGDFEMFSLDENFFKPNRFTAKAIVDSIESGTMPPSGPLSQEDRMTVKKALLPSGGNK